MPCRNSENTIVEAILSVLAQDYRNFELIIVDDGSRDSSVDLIRRTSGNDRRVRLIINPNPGQGVHVARNIALRESEGRYICFLDSDDYLLPGSLSVRVNTATRHRAKIVFGSYVRLLPDGVKTLVKAKSEVSFNDMLKRNHIGNLTGLYDSEVLGVVFQEDIRHEDYLMWCQLIKRAGVAHATPGSPLGVYRVSSMSLSGNKAKAFFWHWRVLRNGLSMSLLQSIYFQFHYGISSATRRFTDYFGV
jgi:glycosyltransferase involved in cell wall biosynthesis